MNIFGTQEQQNRKIKELIIRQQLKSLLPLDIKYIDIVFCAYELNKQVSGYRLDVDYKKN